MRTELIIRFFDVVRGRQEFHIIYGLSVVGYNKQGLISNDINPNALKEGYEEDSLFVNSFAANGCRRKSTLGHLLCGSSWVLVVTTENRDFR